MRGALATIALVLAVSPAKAGAQGDALRGKALVIARESNCVLCHAVPGADERIMGNIGPRLANVGARLTAEQLRARIVDSQRLNPDSVMPSYHRVDGLSRVASEVKGKPIFTMEQVEDVVAYLETLK